MGIFDLFKKSAPLTPEQKLNKLWDMWADGKAPAPYAQLMTYQSEVGNGGHDQYFFNVNESSDVKAEVEALLTILPEPLKDNLQRGYEAYRACPDAECENDEVFSECDDVFYEHESLISALLEAYAETMKL